MTLKAHIDDIRNNLKKGLFTTEAAVSQGIVLRLLNTLGWHTYDPQIVIPEYSVEGTRVDFALCPPESKPKVFIEVKKVGKTEGGERQLFEYAFYPGVPIAILTDGQKWHFFHPIGEGGFEERKVRELDLIQDDSQENAKCLDRYLNYEAIRTGEASKAIKEDYVKVLQEKEAEKRLPEAWNKLVEEADEFLLHAVAEKTEDLCGHRPADEQVLSFLKNLEKKTEGGVERPTDKPLSQRHYRLPLLMALEQLGGSGRTAEVLEKIRQLMADELQPIDFSHNSNGQVHWRHRVQTLRFTLGREGLMKDDSPRGIWEISEEGREELLAARR